MAAGMLLCVLFLLEELAGGLAKRCEEVHRRKRRDVPASWEATYEDVDVTCLSCVLGLVCTSVFAIDKVDLLKQATRAGSWVR